jgi:hypothetical protein
MCCVAGEARPARVEVEMLGLLHLLFPEDAEKAAWDRHYQAMGWLYCGFCGGWKPREKHVCRDGYYVCPNCGRKVGECQ